MKKKVLSHKLKLKTLSLKKDENLIIWAAWADRITFEEIEKNR